MVLVLLHLKDISYDFIKLSTTELTRDEKFPILEIIDFGS